MIRVRVNLVETVDAMGARVDRVARRDPKRRHGQDTRNRGGVLVAIAALRSRF